MAAPIPSLPPQDAMAIIGFTPAEVTALLEVTAVVLKLGNVELSSCFQASGMEASSIAEPQGTVGRGGSDGPPPRSPHSGPSSALSRTELQEISQLVGLDPSTLEQALCSRTVKVRDESVLTALSVSQVSRVPPLPPPLGLAPRDPREPPSPLPRATTAVMRWPRTSTAVCSTGWWTASTPASG